MKCGHVSPSHGYHLCISIHTPLTGCDLTAGARGAMTFEFQLAHPIRGVIKYFLMLMIYHTISTRTPIRGVTTASPKFSCLIKFQLAHPMRGVTATDVCGDAYVSISTHTPYTGCDRRKRKTAPSREKFQLARPIRGVTRTGAWAYCISAISIRTPYTGCDVARAASFVKASKISIRTPHTGCDSEPVWKSCPCRQYFNSHTPYEVRPGRIAKE